MKLYSYGEACVPVPEPAPKFMQLVLEEQKKVVYDSNGNELTTEVVSVSIPKPIPDEVFENRGISCDLFDVDTQIKAGVQLHQFDGDFYGVPLESREAYENRMNDFLDKIQASEVPAQPNSETIKFNE